MKTISIIGCGWLGLPLGRYLSEKNYLVKGSTTHEEKLETLQGNGIEPYLLKLNPQLECEYVDNFLDSNVLIINIPPKISIQKTDAHVEQIANLLKVVENSPIRKIIYISSTSVYPELNREVVEEDVLTPETSASPTMVKAENLLKSFSTEVTILRSAGLMGYDRIPAKYFAGWKGLTTGDIPVNYIHRDDVIRIIETVIEKEIWGDTFNIVSPIHPIRKEIYTQNCEELGFEMPEFVEAPTPHPYKIINGDKWLDKSGYHFLFKNPLDYFYQLPE
ncbi:SDR family NAD(P)-dependent oxidoreductase [Emticicia sp. C21]|uniref:SDR family NAD(P)-dependent oxidoreductase n=1 Tax=Emticicia sp. C21 TaxID=2302915 RepID=UPI000E34603C|nr:SDR family NAD(P)-dependent oxidoreductase [Emticicia sp. C21]RFS17312.1 SDR family NAD(P)-dependent oxidoreductase [Emticicia sp. C21]